MEPLKLVCGSELQNALRVEITSSVPSGSRSGSQNESLPASKTWSQYLNNKLRGARVAQSLSVSLQLRS